MANQPVAMHGEIMKLTPVESSHIAAIGYLEDERLLIVRYKDGDVYAFERVTHAAHDALMESSAKGAFMHQWRGMGILITKGGNAGDTITPEQSGAASTTAPVNPAPALSVADMRKHQKPTSAADCAFAVIR